MADEDSQDDPSDASGTDGDALRPVEKTVKKVAKKAAKKAIKKKAVKKKAAKTASATDAKPKVSDDVSIDASATLLSTAPIPTGGVPESPSPAGPTTTLSTEANSMAEENTTPNQNTPPEPSSAVVLGPGAAVATWGPLALLALLIVIFRAGDGNASASAAPSAHPPAADHGALGSGAPLGGSSTGLSLPPLTLPGSDKLIEELSANPWKLGALGGGAQPPLLGPPASPRNLPPAPGAMAAIPQMGKMMPPSGPWGAPDPASGYWGPPPPGYPGAYPAPYGQPNGGRTDAYWWTQGAQSLPPPPPRQ